MPTEKTIKDTTYNPSKRTVLETIEIYYKDTPSKVASFKNYPEFKPFHNMPLTQFFEQAKDIKINPYKKLYDRLYSEHGGVEETIKPEADPKGSGVKGFANPMRTAKSFMSVLSDIHRTTAPQHGISVDSSFNILATVPKFASRAPAKGDNITFEWDKLGEFQLALMDDIRKNPKNRNTTAAILLNLHVGLRSEEVANLTFGMLQKQKKLSHASGIVGKGSKKTKINAPLGPRAYAIIQNQLKYLKSQGVEITPTTRIFPDVTTDKMTKVVQSVNVPGLRKIELTDGSIRLLNNMQEADDIRNFHVTFMKDLTGSFEVGAEVKARASGTTSLGAEPLYYGGPQGMYTKPIVRNLIEFDKHLIEFLIDAGEIKLPEGQMLDMDSDLINIAINNSDGNYEFKYVPIDPTFTMSTHVDLKDAGTEMKIEKLEGPEGSNIESDKPRHLIQKIKDLPAYMRKHSGSKLSGIFAGFMAHELLRNTFENPYLLAREAGEEVVEKVLTPALGAKAFPAVAVPSMIFEPSSIGEEKIDPRTGQVYREDDRPLSEGMSEEEILKRSRMAKGQFQPSMLQQTLLDRETQDFRRESQLGQSVEKGTDTFDETELGQSFTTGSDNPNFLNQVIYSI